MEFLIPYLQDRATQSNLVEPEENFKYETENDSSSGLATPFPSPVSTTSVTPRYARLQQSKKTSSSQPQQGLEQTLC